MSREAEANPRLLREAVRAHGHKCCVCGRGVGDAEARRHSEPGPFGDTPLNFAAMCAGCRSWLDGRAPAPARYVVHIHDGRRAWERLRRWTFKAIAALTVVAYLAFVAVTVWLVIFATEGMGHALAAVVLFILLIAMGNGFLEGLLGKWRLIRLDRTPPPAVDEPAVPARHHGKG